MGTIDTTMLVFVPFGEEDLLLKIARRIDAGAFLESEDGNPRRFCLVIQSDTNEEVFVDFTVEDDGSVGSRQGNHGRCYYGKGGQSTANMLFGEFAKCFAVENFRDEPPLWKSLSRSDRSV